MKIVVLTGAGISAESGLGTFRDSGGLWEKHKIEDVATPEAWFKNPEKVLNFYNARRLQNDLAKPNSAHFALAKLEKYFEVTIITQNIDNLHEKAGSTNIIHLHGEIVKSKSSETCTEYQTVKNNISLGDLHPNGKQLRPHVVWFGEAVPEMDNAESYCQSADLLIIVGTSLKVYPAANLIHCVDVNCSITVIDPNSIDATANVHIKENASVGLPQLVDKLIKQKKEEL